MDAVMESLRAFWLDLGQYVPRLVGALVLLVAGWVAAKLLRRSAIRLFKAVRLDGVAERAGIEDFLLQGGVRYTAVTILANILYWFLMLAVGLSVLHLLGLDTAAELFNRVVLYLPNVVAAVFLLLLGALLGRFARASAFAYLNNAGVEGAALISLVAQWAIWIFIASMALEQLQIGGQVLISAFQIAFGAFCLALAIAFGLGGRRKAAQIIEKLWNA